MQDWQDQSDLALRRLETSISTLSRSIGTLSQSLNQIQSDLTKSEGSWASIEDTLRGLTTELGRLETALKEHMSGHVDILSESLVGRGGFWKGIWMVVAVQAAGWVVYEIYRNKKDTEKKFL